MFRRISLPVFLVAFAAAVVAAPVPKDAEKKLPDTDEAVSTTEAERAAVRTTSSNNLKHIGVGVHNYASATQDKIPRISRTRTASIS